VPVSARAQQPLRIFGSAIWRRPECPIWSRLWKRGFASWANRGKTLRIEYRFDGRKSERLDTLASELVQLGPDTIVAVGTPAAFVAKRATTTVPIVMAPVGDPVRYGIVASLTHPGGNISGVTLYGSELSGKRVEVSKKLCQESRASLSFATEVTRMSKF
jgi:putative tryptophan/tyrosine transport system substrate-binding protein